MTDIVSLQSIAVVARPGDKAILSAQSAERGTLLFTIDRDQLQQLNTDIVDVLMHREQQ